MKKENTDLSRRTFLSKSAAFAAGSSIIAIPALAANIKGAEKSVPMMFTNDPVYTETAQTLLNKTIASDDNILGTDAVNIKEFSISGSDITVPLQDALDSLFSTGGQIIIPRGVWTTDGGHLVYSAITIQGVGINSGIFTMGSVIKLNSGESSFMFKLLAPTRNVGFKDFAIDLTNNTSATGIVMTDIDGTSNYIYSTTVENVGIYGGEYGIKVETSSTTQYESNLNNFKSVYFVGCRTCFYNNTINSGFTFENCHFYLPTSVGETPGGTALDCYLVGNISLKHCVFVGTQVREELSDPVTDGSTILKTTGYFNCINFYDCQDENVQYAYQNSTNPWVVASLVYRNCLIQSNFLFNGHGNVTLDSCRCAGTIYDTSTGTVRVYLKGVWNFFGYNTTTLEQITYESPESHVGFNSDSQIIYENLEVNASIIKNIAKIETGGYYIVNATRGVVDLPSGSSYVQVYNNTVTANSLVFLQLKTYDSGGARIREVSTFAGYFIIYLTQNAATDLSIAFMVEA